MTDLANWLAAHGLGQYEKIFVDNDVDLEVLPELTDEELKELGVSLGHRKKLRIALAGRDTTEEDGARQSTAVQTGEAERRQLTIMFCDLADSTKLSQELDAEELREVNRAYQDVCKRAIERYDGYVARYMGDGVLAYFGYPQAHEDDAERAVHAGLGVVASVAAIDSKVGHRGEIRLDVRVGIATGPVVVGDLIGEGASQESAVVGETPNLAARLQGLAAPNTVVISPSTHALSAGRFELEDLGRHSLKGMAEPVHAWRVIAASIAESRFDAAHRAGFTALVGREQEIELLLERWTHAKEGDGQVVLLYGEAGIGKSRIIESLRDRTARDDPIRLRYQCSPYHMSSSLHPIIEQLERAARFEADDTDEDKLDKLESLVAAGTRDVQAVAALIAPLLSIGSAGRYAPLEMSPERQKEHTLEALVAQLEGLSRSRPVLFMFEDAHWADPTSLELLEMTVSRVQSLPVLAVVTFRPESPSLWASYTHVTSLTLNRFTRGLVAAMVDKVSGGKPLPGNVLDQIIEKTDGVPLFVEELTKTILESGLLTEGPDGYGLSGSLSDVAIPATLHDSLMARLDRLGAVKEVAQTASVIGREFDYDLLAAVSTLGFAELRGALGQLVDAELVFHRGRSQDDRYFFKHALVRDAAYGSLLKRKRREIHGRIADVLESRFQERAEREPELLARHLTEAGLAERAAPYWRDAGRISSSRSAYAEAISQFEEGVNVLGDNRDDPAHMRLLLDLQTGLADSLAWSKGFGAPEVEAAYSRAHDTCRRAGDAQGLFGVLWGLWHFFLIRGNLTKALELAHELRGIADAGSTPGRRAQAYRALGETLLWQGEFATSRVETEAGIASYEAGADIRIPGGEDAAVANRCMNAVALWSLGFPDQALKRATEAIALSEATDIIPDRCMAVVFIATVHLLRRDFEDALRWSGQLLELSTESGMRFFEAFATIYLGSAAASLGSPGQGAQDIVRGIEMHDETGGGTIRAWFLTMLAGAHLEAGQAEEATAALEKARRYATQLGENWCLAELHRLEAQALLQSDDRAGAEACLARAIDVARRQQANSFELRACIDLARLNDERDGHQHVREILLPVFNRFTEGFDTPDLQLAKALLEKLP